MATAPASSSGGGAQTPASLGIQFLDLIKSALGTPYLWGGTSPFAGGADCSGLVFWAAGKLGLKVPRTSEAMWSQLPHVSANNVQAGDLVFFPGSDGTVSSPGHVGIVVGPGKMIDDPSTGEVVRYDAYSTTARGIGQVVGFARIPGLSGAGLAPDQSPPPPPGGGGVDPSTAIQSASAFLHDISIPVAWFLELWTPGQAWRLAFGVGAVASGLGGIRMWRSAGEDPDGGALPLAIGLLGAAGICTFLTFRPWPLSSAGKALTPTYVATQTIKGTPPPAGAPVIPPTGDVEAGLITIFGLWAAAKTASALSSATLGVAAGASLWSKISGFLTSGEADAVEG